MKPILLLYWQLCRLRAGPENVPFSPELLAATLGGWAVLQTLLAPLQTDLGWGQVMAAQLLGIGILMLATLLLLAFKNLGGRMVQTLTALVGIDIVLSLVGSPLLVVSGMAPELQSQAWFQMLFFLLLCWQLLAQGFVFHRALNVGPLLGTAVAMMVLVLTMVSVAQLVPGILESSA